MPEVERTLSIVKPDGVAKGVIGDVIRRFEDAGLRVVALKMVKLSSREAGGFYIVHRERPFYEDLRKYMSSGPVVVMVLEGTGAIDQVRRIMGATDPVKAEPGTIRADHAESIERNIVHGSDSAQSADFEIPYFFPAVEIHSP